MSGERAVYKDFRTFLARPKELSEKAYLAGLKWLESERKGEGSKIIDLENISDLIIFAELHKIRDLKGQCDSFAKENVKLLILNENGKGIDEAKWLEWMNLSTKHNLPQLSKACAIELSNIRVDLTNPKSAKHLFDVSKTIEKYRLNDPLFFEKGRYPPVKFNANGKTISVHFAKLIHFSKMFQMNLEYIDYEEGTSLELRAPFDFNDMNILNQWMEAKNQGNKSGQLIIDNWKKLYLMADYFDIPELKVDCEKGGTLKLELNEAIESLQLAVTRQSSGVRDTILSVMTKNFRSFSFEEKVLIVSSMEDMLNVAASDNNKESADKLLKFLVAQYPSLPKEIREPLLDFFNDYYRNKYRSSELDALVFKNVFK